MSAALQQDQPSTRLRDTVRVLSRWTGFCLPCGAEDRPLVLVWTGPANLRVRLLGPVEGTGRLSLTCGLCGATDHVGWEDEHEEPGTGQDDAPAPAAELLTAFAAFETDVPATGVQDEPAPPAEACVEPPAPPVAVEPPAPPVAVEPVRYEAVQDEPARYAPPPPAPVAPAPPYLSPALSTEVADALRELGLPVGPPVSATPAPVPAAAFPVPSPALPVPSPALPVPGLADLPAPRTDADLDAVSLLRGT